MATHKIKADLDVDGEVQGTSLDINGDGNISGQLGINTAPAAGVELHVNGEIRVDGTDGVATRMIRSSYFSTIINNKILLQALVRLPSGCDYE